MTVTVLNFCQPFAPSISAASYRSPGMDWRAPVATTELSGQPSHVFAVIIAKYASGSGMNGIGSSTWRSQSRLRPGASAGMPMIPPSAWSR